MLNDKVVVITGASRGIGKAIAQQFAHEGARVVLIARHPEPLKQIEDALRSTGTETLAITADITQLDDCQRAVQQIRALHPEVDILVNNVGMAIRKPFAEMMPDDWQTVMDTNFESVLNMTHVLLPKMVQHGSGTIINFSAAVAHKGYSGLAVYCAAKAAIIAFGASLAKEVRRDGIQVYTVCPHAVNTDLYHGLFGGADRDKLLEPAQVAHEIVQLASGQRGLASGQSLDIALTLSHSG